MPRNTVARSVLQHGYLSRFLVSRSSPGAGCASSLAVAPRLLGCDSDTPKLVCRVFAESNGPGKAPGHLPSSHGLPFSSELPLHIPRSPVMTQATLTLQDHLPSQSPATQSLCHIRAHTHRFPGLGWGHLWGHCSAKHRTKRGHLGGRRQSEERAEAWVAQVSRGEGPAQETGGQGGATPGGPCPGGRLECFRNRGQQSIS